MAQEVTLITGASSGIGEALARRVARDGKTVAVVARRADRLHALAGELKQQHGVEAYAFPTDLTKPGACAALASEVAGRGLAVDWLINNAGFGTYGRFDRLPLEKEMEEIQLNIGALVELTHRFLPGMVAHGHGAVINVASVAGFAPGPYMATYCATKAFVKSFSEALAVELQETGVKVLCVCPGFTRTSFQDTAGVDPSRIPDFAWMSAEEVADQAVRGVGRSAVLVNGIMNSVTASTIRLLPSSLTSRMMGSVMRNRIGT